MPSLDARPGRRLARSIQVEAGQLDRSTLARAAAPRIAIRPVRVEDGDGSGMAAESASPLTRFGVIVECAVSVSCCGNRDVRICNWSEAERHSLFAAKVSPKRETPLSRASAESLPTDGRKSRRHGSVHRGRWSVTRVSVSLQDSRVSKSVKKPSSQVGAGCQAFFRRRKACQLETPNTETTMHE